MSEQNTSRITFIDYAKTMCIFLMIVGHWTTSDILLSYIYSFHMPVLFVVSGYLYRPHSWIKTIIGFSIPVVFFSLVNLAVNILLGNISIYSLSIRFIAVHVINWRHGLGEGLFNGLWFIYALVGIRLLFGDISGKKLSRIYYVPLAIIIIVYMALEKYHASIDTLFRGYYIGTIIPSLPFFCLGIFLKDKQWHPKHLDSAKYIIPSVILFLIMPATNNYCDIYNSQYGHSYLIAAVNAWILSLLLFVLTNRLPPSKYVETISKGTLIVLGTHMPILHILDHFLPKMLSFLFPIITIVVCYYLIIFCERYCPILLGKWKYISFAKNCIS
mgnify:CR=1 FL=1